MILGLSIPAFVAVHVAISLIGIATGLVALGALATGRFLKGWQAAFLITTILTSVTGFMFPFGGVTPAFGFGVISLIVLAIALVALLRHGRRGRAGAVYAISATIALYLNLFVLVVQSFLKVPALQTLAPTQTEPPFAIAQGIVLLASLWLGWRAVRVAHEI